MVVGKSIPKDSEMLFYKDDNLIDADALDFMVNYNLVLTGNVHRELSDGIKNVIMSGIITGKSSDDIVRDMGRVIKKRESFKHAAKKVFSKVQYRMKMIARTKVLRAHNQGWIKFYNEVGVQKLEWMTMADERVCPVCGSLDGKIYTIDKFPQQPNHVLYLCSNVIAYPLDICSLDSGSSKGSEKCIKPPQSIENRAKLQFREKSKIKAVLTSGKESELANLNLKQIQSLSKTQKISRSRAKNEIIKTLDQLEPGFDHSELSGQALDVKIKQFQISRSRSKKELIKFLIAKQKQVELVQKQHKQSKMNSHA